MDKLFVGLTMFAAICCFTASLGYAIQAGRSDLVRAREGHGEAHASEGEERRMILARFQGGFVFRAPW